MLGRFYYSSVHRPRHPHSVLFEIPLAVVSAGEAMQDEVPMLRFESGQVRTKTWMFREAIHARSADLETRALRVEMNIDSRCALSEQVFRPAAGIREQAGLDRRRQEPLVVGCYAVRLRGRAAGAHYLPVCALSVGMKNRRFAEPGADMEAEQDSINDDGTPQNVFGPTIK